MCCTNLLFIATALIFRICNGQIDGYSISTYAGKYTIVGTTSGDDGSATSAGFVSVSQTWSNSHDQLFVLDTNEMTNNSNIRQIDYTSQTISRYSSVPGSCKFLWGNTDNSLYVTSYSNSRVFQISSASPLDPIGFAGSGLASYFGDKGPATSAGVAHPTGIWGDTEGNMYFGQFDDLTPAVRKVDTSGTITTIAGGNSGGSFGDGGAATACGLSSLWGLHGDSSGNLFLSDQNTFRIRKVSLSTNVITPIGATGTEAVFGVWSDLLGGVYYSTMSAVRYIFPGTTTNDSFIVAAGDNTLTTSASISGIEHLAGDSTGVIYLSSKTRGVVHRLLPPSVPLTAESSTLVIRRRLQQSFSIDKFTESNHYRPRNLFAFAALTESGKVVRWGSRVHGGSFSSNDASSDVVSIASSVNGFSALTSAGSVRTWGEDVLSERSSHYQSGALQIMSLVGNEYAYAGITSSGGVISFGGSECGGNVTATRDYYETYLTSEVSSVTASACSFAALKSDGTVFVWGSNRTGEVQSSMSKSELVDVESIYATKSSYAALKTDGSVIAWGSVHSGGDISSVSSQLRSDVVHVFAGSESFVAVKSDRSLVVWGNPLFGGDASAVSGRLTSVEYIARTAKAFAVVQTNGSVVTWGESDYGGDSSSVTDQLTDVRYVYGTDRAFAALRGNGTVITWGDSNRGGNLTMSLNNVMSISATRFAFAALKGDGSVAAWGHPTRGGVISDDVAPYLTSGVKLICANDVSFTAIKYDGKLIVWGHSSSTNSNNNGGGVVVAEDQSYTTISSCI